ncbi:hypothetical protein [Nitrosopumilus sp.]|uniref:hypothetical protein n=1 Tax=Nitrosopumilus sp. TaxID=2024843 RepID=UPI0034A00EA7
MLFKLYNNEGKCNRTTSFVMTKLMTTLTVSAIASILIIGGFATATPNAFSTYGGHHDDDDDDCDNWNYGYNHNDDCDNEDTPKDPCDCEKPDTLKFKFSTPSAEINSEFKIEVYKKLNDIGNEDKKLTSIVDVTNMGDYRIESSSFGKDKLNPNTVFAIYKIVEGQDNILVSSIEVHTSCSQPLYKGLTVMDMGYSLEISDGLKNGETSISESNPLTCGDEPAPEQTGTIVIKNALTNDNGGDAMFEDFTYKLIDVDSGVEFDLIQNINDPSLNEVKVPKGTYTLSQTIAGTGSYTEVLITGDEKCPPMTGEPISIKKGKTISCTIYNDDNGDGSIGGTGGIVFQNNSMEIILNDANTLDSCDVFVDGIQKMPCVEILDDNGNIGIVDSELKSTTTIVLFSVVQTDVDLMEGSKDAKCELERIISHNNTMFLIDNFGESPANPTDNLMVMLGCPEMDNDKNHKVNYIMIDPTFGS